MGKIATPESVKLICGILTSFPQIFPDVENYLIDEFGQIDHRSEVFDFDYTRYYEKEMGSGIKRLFVSFREKIAPDEIASVKLRTNALEKKLSVELRLPVERPVNLDPGYLSPSKLVLATTKDSNHRVYLGSGIYAESTLKYEKGSYRPWPWTYPDYRSDGYIRYFNELRKTSFFRA